MHRIRIYDTVVALKCSDFTSTLYPYTDMSGKYYVNMSNEKQNNMITKQKRIVIVWNGDKRLRQQPVEAPSGYSSPVSLAYSENSGLLSDNVAMRWDSCVMMPVWNNQELLCCLNPVVFHCPCKPMKRRNNERIKRLLTPHPKCV